MSIETILAHVTGLTDAVAGINARLDTINTQQTEFFAKFDGTTAGTPAAPVDISTLATSEEVAALSEKIDALAAAVGTVSDEEEEELKDEGAKTA